MSILHDWYEGKVYPAEQIVCRELAYHKAHQDIDTEMSYFKTKLTSDDSERFEKLEDLFLTTSSLYAYANFAHGLKLGVMFTAEIYTNGDNGD